MNNMNKEKLTELVYISLGRASMCWSEIPRGDFDSTKAAELGKEIMDAVEKYKEDQELTRIMGVEVPTAGLDDSDLSWMELEYYDDYIKLQASGMFFEFHPDWTGQWEKDKYAFCHEQLMKKK